MPAMFASGIRRRTRMCHRGWHIGFDTALSTYSGRRRFGNRAYQGKTALSGIHTHYFPQSLFTQCLSSYCSSRLRPHSYFRNSLFFEPYRHSKTGFSYYHQPENNGTYLNRQLDWRNRYALHGRRGSKLLYPSMSC